MDDDIEHQMAYAEPVNRSFCVEVLARGQVMATLYGRDLRELLARAKRFIAYTNIKQGAVTRIF